MLALPLPRPAPMPVVGRQWVVEEKSTLLTQVITVSDQARANSLRAQKNPPRSHLIGVSASTFTANPLGCRADSTDPQTPNSGRGKMPNERPRRAAAIRLSSKGP